MPDPIMTDDDTPTATELSTELAGWLAAWHRAREKVRHWQAAADTAQQHLTAALDTAGVAVGTVRGRTAVRWTRVESRRVDGARLRAEHPDLAARYSTTVVSHRFTAPYIPPVSGDA